MSSTAISSETKKGYIAAWLGWMFDGLDSVLYTIVAVPFVTQLMGKGANIADVKSHAALIQAFFLFGWACGGAVFGRICDHIGRKRTLTITILTFAIFTALSAVATEWWHLMIFRFIAALGIGGEWAAGASLVSETLHNKHKAWASALLQTGYQVGFIAAALTAGFLPRLMTEQGHADFMYRAVFLVGVIPAFLTLWLRKAVPESGKWEEARKNQPVPKVSELFKPGVIGTTLKVLAFLSIALTTVWTFIFFFPQVLRGLPEMKSLKEPEVALLVSQITIISQFWNVAGNFCATYMAKAIGPRITFGLFMLAGLVCAWFGFVSPQNLNTTVFWINAFSFTGLGIFGIFPLYVPPLFPTLLRTSGAGFCYNFG
ncbi:MAG: MFS transporter, partial [Armatimonadota bacterium]